MFNVSHAMIAGACLVLAGLNGLGCSGQPKTGAPNPHAGHPGVGVSSKAGMLGKSEGEKDLSGDIGAQSGAGQADSEGAEAVEGRWEARFKGTTLLIELKTSDGSLSGSVREGDKQPVPIQIGVVTSDGFVFETGGGGGWLWTAKLSGDVLAGRREKVDTGRVETFDAHRIAY